MALFRRSTTNDVPTDPIAAFWSWWETTGHTIDPTGGAGPWVDDLSAHVKAIDPGLTWEFGPGARTQHRLTLSAEGDAAARAAAQRWYRRAPEPQGTWEFAPAKTRDPGALRNRLRFGDTDLDLSQIVFVFDLDADAGRVHVAVFHPEFPRLEESARGQIAFLVTDWTLGEDAVERWVGALEALTGFPEEPHTTDELIRLVDELDQETDRDQWAIFGGSREGVPLRVITRSGIRWTDAPALDLHHVIDLPYPADDEGMPATTEAVDRLQAVSDQLEGMGRDGLFLAREMSGGVARLHIYTDSAVPAAAEHVAAVASSAGARAVSELDPGWTATRWITG